jgi:hypothetical protein
LRSLDHDQPRWPAAYGALLRDALSGLRQGSVIFAISTAREEPSLSRFAQKIMRRPWTRAR